MQFPETILFDRHRGTFLLQDGVSVGWLVHDDRTGVVVEQYVPSNYNGSTPMGATHPDVLIARLVLEHGYPNIDIDIDRKVRVLRYVPTSPIVGLLSWAGEGLWGYCNTWSEEVQRFGDLPFPNSKSIPSCGCDGSGFVLGFSFYIACSCMGELEGKSFTAAEVATLERRKA